MFTVEDTNTDQVFKGIKYAKGELASKMFIDCTFNGCDFGEAVFKGCRFRDCIFENCHMSLMRVLDCSFSNTEFKHSKVVGVNWAEAAWPKVIFEPPLKFSHCILNHSTFYSLKLQDIAISHCTVKDVDFSETDLSGADLTYSDFSGSIFSETNLTGADFSNARGYTIDVAVNRVKKAKFTLPEAISLLYCLGIQLDEG